MAELSRDLKEFRKTRGLSQEVIGCFSGFSSITIHRFEHPDGRQPGEKTVAKMEEFCDKIEEIDLRCHNIDTPNRELVFQWHVNGKFDWYTLPYGCPLSMAKKRIGL